ncbi:MAG: hypothetical protein AAGA86_07440, partial [Bacteroidota bacterium]
MKFKHLCILVILPLTQVVQGQLSDLARVEYTTLPGLSTDFAFNRIRALINYPVKLKGQGSFLVFGLDYSNIDLTFGEEPRPFDQSQIT